MYFEFNVKGWENTQFLKASEPAAAFDAAVKIGAGESNIYGFRQITRDEVWGFLQDVRGV